MQILSENNDIVIAFKKFDNGTIYNDIVKLINKCDVKQKIIYLKVVNEKLYRSLIFYRSQMHNLVSVL